MYRRNIDENLTQLEQQYQIDEDPQVLRRIDNLRKQSGLPPHPDSRLRMADEILGFARMQCLQALNLDYLGWLMTHDEVPVAYQEQFIPLVTQARSLVDARRWIDMEMRDIMSGLPQGKPYLRLLEQRHLAPIEMGPLPKKAKKSMTPHLARSGATQRFNLAEKLRNETDENAYVILRQLVQLGVFCYPYLLMFYDGTDEETSLGQLQEINESLTTATLAREEIWRAQLDETPDPQWVEYVKDRNDWYSI